MNKVITLLQKFQSGVSTDSEKRQLLDALENNDQELKNWLEENYFLDLKIKRSVISEARSIEIFNKILELKNSNLPIKANNRVKLVSITKPWLHWVAAACIIGFIAMGIFYNSSISNQSTEKKISKSLNLKKHFNNSDTTLVVILQDRSTIYIEPKSTITYNATFVNNRDIHLTGKATFNVAKNIAKPFTVYANGISTRALGTVFSVDANNNNVLVRLIEGKVVVKSVSDKIVFADTYLKPGEQYFINKQNATFIVSTFKQQRQVDKNLVLSNKVKVNNDKNPNFNLEFNKTPLLSVFQKIEETYKVVIKYEKISIENATFTGSFLKTDSLKNILAIICNTNDLQFKEDKGIIIIY